MNALPKQPRDRRPRGGFWRDAGPSAGLLAVLAAAAVGLHLLGRPYLLVFAMNVSMVTLALTLLIATAVTYLIERPLSERARKKT